MATAYLGISRDYFWEMVPAELFGIIDQWYRIEYNRDRQRARMIALEMSGAEIPDLDPIEEEVEMSSFFI